MKVAFMLIMTLKSVLRILICVTIGVELIGCFCINSLMFHPVRHYDASYPGYVDIGTDGMKIAAVTIGPTKGKKAILYCHGNAEDMTDSLSRPSRRPSCRLKEPTTTTSSVCWDSTSTRSCC